MGVLKHLNMIRRAQNSSCLQRCSNHVLSCFVDVMPYRRAGRVDPYCQINSLQPSKLIYINITFMNIHRFLFVCQHCQLFSIVLLVMVFVSLSD